MGMHDRRGVQQPERGWRMGTHSRESNGRAGERHKSKRRGDPVGAREHNSRDQDERQCLLEGETVRRTQDSLRIGFRSTPSDTAKSSVPGREVKKGQSSGVALRAANGEAIPNLGEATVSGNAVIGQGPMKMTAQVAGITKPPASVTEMVDSGIIMVMQKTGGIVKRLHPSTAQSRGPSEG